MDSLADTEDETDGIDDSEFLAEAEKYQEYCDSRAVELLKLEHERQMVNSPPRDCANVIKQVRNVINNGFVRRLEGRMKQARHKAYQFHYEAAMSKVLHEEARMKEEAREAKKNKKRKLLPVVEDPVVKVDRRKGKGRRRPAGSEQDGHTGFVIKIKGNMGNDDMDVDDSPKRHSFPGRTTPWYLPSVPQRNEGDTPLTPSELRAYDRLTKNAEKRFDLFIASVWKEIAKKDVPKAYRQMDTSLKVKQSNAKKTVQLAAKEARRWQARSTKATKEMQNKAKRTMREVYPPLISLTIDACILAQE